MQADTSERSAARRGTPIECAIQPQGQFIDAPTGVISLLLLRDRRRQFRTWRATTASHATPRRPIGYKEFSRGPTTSVAPLCAAGSGSSFAWEYSARRPATILTC